LDFDQTSREVTELFFLLNTFFILPGNKKAVLSSVHVNVKDMLIEEIAQPILELVTIHLDNHRTIAMQAEQRGLRANEQMKTL